MSEALLVAAVPLLAAALLGFVPVRPGAWIGLGAAVIAFALACRAAAGASDAEALGTVLALPAAFVGATTAWFTAHDLPPDSRRARAANALFQAMLGGALLATLADDLALGWIGLTVGTIAAAATAAGGEAKWQSLIVLGTALALSLFGIAALQVAVPAAGWTGLVAAAPGAQPAVLNLAACVLLAGWGTLAALAPLHSWHPAMQAEAGVASGVLSVLLTNAALANLLRLRGVMAACPGALAPGWALVLLGLLSVLGGALLLPRERTPRRLLAMSTVGQGGLAAVAFGLGGAAVLAGVLHLVLHTLSKAALWQGIGRAEPPGGVWRTLRPTAWLVGAAGLAVAGVPPAGVFASEVLVLAEAMRQAPAVAVLAGSGVILGAWALLTRLQALLLAPVLQGTAPPPKPWASLGAWANLALTLVLGLAMPEPVLLLLRVAAR